MHRRHAEAAAVIAFGVTAASVVALAQGGTPAPAPGAADAGRSEPDASAPDGGQGDGAPPDGAPEEMSLSGFALGLHGGYAIPYGTAKGTSLSAVIPGAVLLGVDVGYFLDPHVYVGVYALYGFGVGESLAGTVCGDPSSACSATPIRLGATARWHFLPNESLDPWAGLGLGYEIVNVTETTSTGDQGQSGSLHGFEALLAAGVDYKPRPFYGIGPFVESSLGHFASSSSGTPLHGWLDFGLRLRTRL
jgi:hypothetical protein